MDSKSYRDFLDDYQTKINGQLIPAATVVILRDNKAGGIEVLLVLRNPELKFMGGSWVFPGGKVDDKDFDESKDLIKALFNAAIREVKEETDLEIDPNLLISHSHWIPPPLIPKLFATWFFLAPAPDTEVKVDGNEIIDYQWITPQDALNKRDTGDFDFVPPTFVTINMLNQYSSTQEVLDAATKQTEPSFYETKIVTTTDATIALWRGDAGYETGDPSIKGARLRLDISQERWELENTIDEKI